MSPSLRLPVILALVSTVLAGCSGASDASDDNVDPFDGSSASALTGSTSTVQQLPIVWQSRNSACPASVRIGIAGESFATGVVYTADIKSLIKPGAKTVLGGGETKLQFSAPLSPKYASCIGASAPQAVFDLKSNYQVRFDGKEVIVGVVSPSLAMKPSTFNNQAIFKLSEKL